MNKDGFFAFYGTLRRELENFVPYREALEYLKTVELDGFKLFSYNDFYPYVVISEDQSSKIVAELFYVSDEKVRREIHAMEIEVGYEYEEVLVEGRAYGIYVFRKARTGDLEIVSGDWRQYIEKNGLLKG